MSQSNVTGQINVSDADAVAAEICNIIGARHANFDEQPIRQGFADMQDTCTGLYSGSTRACSAYDMPYHNLTHFLGDCRTFGIKAFSKSGVAKFDHNEDSFCRICRLIAVAMSQKAGEK